MPDRIPYDSPRRGPSGGRARRPAHATPAERKADNAFYCSARWMRLRDAKRAADPLCEPCLAKGLTTLAAHVHHKKPRKPFPELAFVWENLESVCHACHNAKEQR